MEDQNYLILPHFVENIWEQSEPVLVALAQQRMPSVFDFLEKINFLISLHYTTPKKKAHNLIILLRFLETFSQTQLDYFLGTFLPRLAKLALRLKELFPESVQLLKQNKEGTQSLFKEQTACLISHMFFCTFHRQNSQKLGKHWNFIYLYSDEAPSKIPLKLNKLKCFYNYLSREVSRGPSNDRLIFERTLLSPTIVKNVAGFWANSDKVLLPLEFESQPGLIEAADNQKFIKVIFANKRLGGGVLSNGGLQEELLICMNPELLIPSLIFEELDDYEAAIYLGPERYNSTENYADKFLFKSDFKDPTPTDLFDKKDSVYIAIDALKYDERRTQYRFPLILRELNKCYLGFKACDRIVNLDTRKIATGKWGCGEFQGDFELKLLVQWIAASENERSVKFFLYGDPEEKKYSVFCGKMAGKTVGELVNILKEFSRTFCEENVDIGVFDFIRDFCE